jgi:hypothetical protein
MGSKTVGEQAIRLSSVTALPETGMAWCAHRRPVLSLAALPGQVKQLLPASRT